jgi:hypothetical protein
LGLQGAAKNVYKTLGKLVKNNLEQLILELPERRSGPATMTHFLSGKNLHSDAVPDQQHRLRVTLSGSNSSHWIVGIVVVLGLCPGGAGQLPGQKVPVSAAPSRLESQSNKPLKRSTSTDAYVGSQACSLCHSDVYKRFMQTSMGSSMSEISSESLKALPLPAAIDDPKLDRHFEVFARDGRLYEAESQAGKNGTDTFDDTHEVSWIIGAGANGIGTVIRERNYLFQGPLSFYSRAGSWGLSPGYEFGDYGFNRPILAGCIGCHAGRPRPVPATNGRYEDPAFSQLAIGCENCHGPGSEHVALMSGGKSISKSGHLAIVNPARLSSDLANDICMSCHQMGDLRIFKAGKTYADFRPGEPLSNTLAILLVPPRRESPPAVDHLEHYYSMTLSKCYRASEGRLRCITCHDPHIEPSREDAPGYFSKKCMACHNEKSCALPINVRKKQNPPDNCIGCHMPKRDVQTIQHASITNHRILARPDEPFTEAAFNQTTAALPDLIQLDPAPGKREVAPPLLTLLQAYGELLDTKPEYADRYSAMLSQLERTEPNSALVQSALGRRDLRSGKYEEALAHLQSAIAIGPPQAVIYADLGEVCGKLGRPQEALAYQEKAVALDPFNPVLQKSEIVSYINLKRYAEAKAALELYLKTFPQDSFMRQMLRRAVSGADAR